MGEEVRGVPEAAPLSDERPPSIGRYLAVQRRLRGLSIDELSAATKIPRRSLERLEEGAFDHSTDGFARGFVRTVASALGLDPDATVNRLLVEPSDADEDSPFAALPGGRIALAAVALAALLAAAWGLWSLEPGGEAAEEATAGDASEIVVREDAVRALADRVGAPEEGPPLPSAGGERED